MNLFSYWNADKIVLRMYGAREVDAEPPRRRWSAHYVADVLRAGRARGPARGRRSTSSRPDQPNAFATGRDPDHAAVAATTRPAAHAGPPRDPRRDGPRAGAREEPRHPDHDHHRHHRRRRSATLANFALFFGGRDDEDARRRSSATIALMILAPMAAGLVQMAISRGREYEADRIGAEIAGDPQALASALQKIEAYAARLRQPRRRAQSGHGPHVHHQPWANGDGADNLFSTHPATPRQPRGGANEAARPARRWAVRRSLAADAAGATAVPTTDQPKAGPWNRR